MIEKLMKKWEKESWEKKEEITYQIFRESKSKDGRAYWLKLEKVEQSKKFPSGISQEDALSIGHRVYRVTTMRERIK